MDDTHDAAADPVETITVTSSPATATATSSHLWPLLILALAILVSYTTLTLYGHTPDPALPDTIVGISGAIAGVTWGARR